MSLLVFQHAPDQTPSQLGAVLRNAGHRLRVIEPTRGERVPGDLDGLDGILALGGPMNTDQTGEHPWLTGEQARIAEAHEAGLPVVGVGLGAQLVGEALGGRVEALSSPAAGWYETRLLVDEQTEPVYAGIPWRTAQFCLHERQLAELPEGGRALARTAACDHAAFKVGLRTYGFQYHFEWNRDELKRFARHPLVQRAGADPVSIDAETEKRYPNYRRLGNRLAERLALFVMPVEKRLHRQTTRAAS